MLYYYILPITIILYTYYKHSRRLIHVELNMLLKALLPKRFHPSVSMMSSPTLPVWSVTCTLCNPLQTLSRFSFSSFVSQGKCNKRPGLQTPSEQRLRARSSSTARSMGNLSGRWMIPCNSHVICYIMFIVTIIRILFIPTITIIYIIMIFSKSSM